jgi:phage/plasmid-associated DNA primase
MASDLLANTFDFLDAHAQAVGDSVLIPLRAAAAAGAQASKAAQAPLHGKAPMFKHSKPGAWNADKARDFHRRTPEHANWGMLLDKLVALDADDADAVRCIEALQDPDAAAALAVCPVQETRKGRHYLFLRPAWADEEGFWDGARQVQGIAVDVKTRCSTGTRGLLVVAPSDGKRWIREPWADGAALVEIPRALLELVATPRRPRQARQERPRAAAPASVGAALGACLPSRPEPAAAATTSTSEVAALVRCLDVARATTYRTWMEVGWCLHNVDAEALLPVWEEFSRRAQGKYKPGECALLWQQMQALPLGRRALRVGSLHVWARQDSPTEYRHVVAQRLASDIRACNGSHNDVARIARKILGDRFACASSNGKLWYAFEGRWLVDPGAIKLRHELSTTVREQFMLAVHREAAAQSVDDMQSDAASHTTLNNAKALMERMSHIAFRLQDSAFKNLVVMEMREYFFDATFLDRLDASPALLGFDNGVWDLEAGAFRPGCPDDMVSYTVGYEYRHEVSDADAARVARYWETLHPDPEQRGYALRTFARQLYGDSGQELFHIHAGFRASASNGKSRFFELMDLCLGDYSRKFGVELLTSKQRIEPGKPMPEFATWKGVRILYCSEPNHDEVLNSGVLKDLTGGEAVTYRLLHSSDIVRFRPQFKLHMMCNDTPRVDGSDSGIQRRTRKLDYVSRFVDAQDADEARNMYARDTAINTAFKTSTALRMEFIRLLLRNYEHAFAFDMSRSVKENSKQFLSDNNAVVQFAEEHVVRDDDAVFLLKEAKEAFKRCDYFNFKLKTFKQDLERVLGTVCQEQKRVQSRGGAKFTGVFDGFRLE